MLRSRIAFCLVLAATAWSDGPPGTSHQSQQSPPIQLGTTGGNINDISRVFCCGGTLGALLSISGTQYILGNNHILARLNQGAVGEDILHPGLIDQSPVCSQDTADRVADLSDFETIQFIQGNNRPANKVDAAIAQIVSGKVDTTGDILDIGPPSTTTAAPQVGLAVKKSGRGGLTTGGIAAIDVDFIINYQEECGIGRQRRALFTGQFGIGPAGFVVAGDSGSLVVEDCTPLPKPVGMVFAGSGSLTFANPISDVLAAFPGSGIVGGGPPCASTTSASAASTDRLEAASRAKARHRDALFNLPEVVGHGVGLSQSGEPVIQLYVRQANGEARRAAPARLDGFRVELVETGDIYGLAACKPAR